MTFIKSSRWLGVAAYTLVMLGFLVALLAVLWTIFASVGFYRAALKLPHGEGVRPMGLATFYVFCAGAGFLLGIPLAVAGGILCEKRRYKGGALLAKVSIILGFLPFPLGMVLIRIAASAAGVVLEE